MDEQRDASSLQRSGSSHQFPSHQFPCREQCEQVQLRIFLEEIQLRMEALGTTYLRGAARLRGSIAAIDAGEQVPPGELRAMSVLMRPWMDPSSNQSRE